MNLLQKKVELSRRSQFDSEDPRLAGATFAAVKAVLPQWIGEEGWTVSRHTTQWVKSSKLSPGETAIDYHLYRENQVIMMVGVSPSIAARASAFALGHDPDTTTHRFGSFEQHHGKALTESLWRMLTGMGTDFELGQWSLLEALSPVPFANGPDQLLRLDATLTREDTPGEFSVTLFAQNIPLAEELIEDEDEEDNLDESGVLHKRATLEAPIEPDVELDIADLKDRLGPCRLSVHIVGDKLSLSVADCTRLEIGQVFSLPRLQFDNVTLRLVSGGRRRDLAQGTLGMDKGQKAVRLHGPPDPEFFAQAADFIKDEEGSQTPEPSAARPPARSAAMAR